MERPAGKPNFEKSKALLKEAGYDGTPIVLMQSTDLPVLTNLAPVTKSLLEKGRLQGRHAVDGLADAGHAPHQEGPGQQGRLERLPHLLGVGRRAESDFQLLLRRQRRQGDGSAGRAIRKMEKLRDDYARETDTAKGKALAEAVQTRALETAAIGCSANGTAGRRTCQRQRLAEGAGAGVLERREEVTRHR